MKKNTRVRIKKEYLDANEEQIEYMIVDDDAFRPTHLTRITPVESHLHFRPTESVKLMMLEEVV